VFLAICFAVTRVVMPRALAYVASLSVQSEELYQMMLVAFCLAVAWVSDYFGLSIELGACACASSLLLDAAGGRAFRGGSKRATAE